MKNSRAHICAIFILTICCSGLFALQGGPVMPEYVQFEPSDAPDIVNLNTGDFSYTIPLGNVPGPYGNYPLSIGYHAGIGPNQEATWVGLGWSLNPGAISRTLRGIPDDLFQGSALSFVYAYENLTVTDEGYSLSIWKGVGLDVSKNSYSGYGFNVTVQLGKKGPGVSFGTDGIGISYGKQIGKSGVGINGSLHWDGSDLSGSAGMSSRVSNEVSMSMGVHVNAKGKATGQVGMHRRTNNASTGVTVSSSGYISASVKGLEQSDATDFVTIGGVGLSLTSTNSSVRGAKKTRPANFNLGLMRYSREHYQNWTRQASTEGRYGYLYQAGPAIVADEPYNGMMEQDDYEQNAGYMSSGSILWDLIWRGKKADQVGNIKTGEQFPGYDIFHVSGEGVAGSFRAYGSSKHKTVAALELIEGLAEDDKDKVPPNLMYYVMKQTEADKVYESRQEKKIFQNISEDTELDDVNWGVYPYSYCYESGKLNYLTNESEKLEKIINKTCSKYAMLKSNFLNQGNRWLYSKNPEQWSDLSQKYNSRMNFRFMGSKGGYFESEDWDETKDMVRQHINSEMFKKKIKDWSRWDDTKGADTWDVALAGEKQVYPILETVMIDGKEKVDNVGRLQGFRIISTNGTEYIYKQPIYSVMHGTYSINNPTGGPSFIDKNNAHADDTKLDVLMNIFSNADVLPWNRIGTYTWEGFKTFLLYSPVFRTKCDDDNRHKNYHYSYHLDLDPYATQWAISEIRGPDFVDFGDKKYGYYVKFNYSEPTYYNWRTPYALPGLQNKNLPNMRVPQNIVTDEGCKGPEIYQASFGVRREVYLKSIETQTHKAIFNLNPKMQNGNAESIDKQRLDGKGWMFSWKNTALTVADERRLIRESLEQMYGDYFTKDDYINREQLINKLKWRETTPYGSVPIMVNSNFSVELVPGDGTKYREKLISVNENDDDEGIGTPQYNLFYKEYPVLYKLKKIYLNFRPLPEQIKAFLREDNPIKLKFAGVSHSGTHEMRLKKDTESEKYIYNYDYDIQWNLLDENKCYNTQKGALETCTAPEWPYGVKPKGSDEKRNYNKKVFPMGFVFKKDIQKYFDVKLKALRPTKGSERHLGAYEAVLDDSENIWFDGYVRSDVRYTKEDEGAEPFSDYFDKPFTMAYADLNPDDNKVINVGPGEGNVRFPIMQTMVLYNSFLEFIEEDPSSNQKRYLQNVVIAEKKKVLPEEELAEIRKFEFSYDYSLHPHTPNSYKISDVVIPKGKEGKYIIDFEDYKYFHRGNGKISDPTLPGGPAASFDFKGRLTLKAIREVHCVNDNCSEFYNMPPFTFDYHAAEATAVPDFGGTLNRDQTLDRMNELFTIAGNKQDEWGLFNPSATFENRFAYQYGADASGTAWSLGRIVEPSGGSLEIHYERDTYIGESYAEGNLAIPVGWSKCKESTEAEMKDKDDYVCLDFYPRMWVEKCRKDGYLQGQWELKTGEEDLSEYLNYIYESGIVEGAELYFNLQQTMETEVGCGLKLGDWKSHGCDRHRSISVVGRLKLGEFELHENVKKPYFDAYQYDLDASAFRKQCEESIATGGAHYSSVKECIHDLIGWSEGSFSCTDDAQIRYSLNFGTGSWTIHTFTKPYNKYQKCDYSVVQFKTNLKFEHLANQYRVLANKINERDWWGGENRFGLVWIKNPHKLLKGGDLRVKHLVRKDLNGQVQATSYKYEPGEFAQYPDSVFSGKFAVQFSTGRATSMLNRNEACKNEDDGPTCDAPIVEQNHSVQTKKSRISGIDDDNLMLLPPPVISYPKVTVFNDDLSSKESKAYNGFTEFEFITPENRASIEISLNEVRDDDTERGDFFVSLGTEQPIYRMTDLGEDKYHFILRADYGPKGLVENTKKVVIKKFKEGILINSVVIDLEDSNKPVKKVQIEFDSKLSPIAKLKNQENTNLKRDWEILTRLGGGFTSEKQEVEFEDRTAALGKSISTAFYREITEKYNDDKDQRRDTVLLEKNEFKYAFQAPSIDKRFVEGDNAKDSDIEDKLGFTKETWAYEINARCYMNQLGPKSNLYPNCNLLEDEPSVWSQYLKFIENPNLSYERVHTKFPHFMVENKSTVGFNSSRQPWDEADELGENKTDYIQTVTTYHKFDPVTGNPTVLVSYTGPDKSSPSKVTRMTPAYIVDPGQEKSDLPNWMFVKNRLKQMFREDVYTFTDKTQLSATGKPVDFDKVEFDEDFKPFLVKTMIKPVTQDALYRHSEEFVPDEKQPLLALGGFTNRFLGKNWPKSGEKPVQNVDLFEGTPDLNLWSGTKIVRINEYNKILESEDLIGRRLVNRYGAKGRMQTAVFWPANYYETAVLTSTNFKSMGENRDFLDDFWSFSTAENEISISDGFLEFPEGELVNIWHYFEPVPETRYIAELQAFSSRLFFVNVVLPSKTAGKQWTGYAYLKPGTHTYQIKIDTEEDGTQAANTLSFITEERDGISFKLKYLRVYPEHAQAKSFVYDDKNRIVQSIDEGNASIYYDYNNNGDLISLRNDDGLIKSEQVRVFHNTQPFFYGAKED